MVVDETAKSKLAITIIASLVIGRNSLSDRGKSFVWVALAYRRSIPPSLIVLNLSARRISSTFHSLEE
jgi:hypothetical protein